jgi:hypothetical protein
MTRRDQELLDRQLHAICVPQRRDGGTVMLAIATLVLGGLFLGNLHAAKTQVSGLQSAIAIAGEANSGVSQ